MQGFSMFTYLVLCDERFKKDATAINNKRADEACQDIVLRLFRCLVNARQQLWKVKTMTSSQIM